MADQITLPVTRVPQLFSEETARAVDAYLPALETAPEGALVGVLMEFRYRDDTQGLPITIFLLQGRDDKIVHCRYTDLDEAARPGAADLAMILQSDLAIRRDIDPYCADFSAGDGEVSYTNLHVFRDFAYHCLEDFHHEILEGRYFGEPIDQGIVEECFHIVIPTEIRSAHEMIARRETLRNCLARISRFADIIADPAESDARLEMTLPHSF